MLTLVSKDSVKNSDHFDVLCVLIACMVLEIINQNQTSKNQKSSLIVWNTVYITDAVQVMVTRESTCKLFKHVPRPCIYRKDYSFFFFFEWGPGLGLCTFVWYLLLWVL